MAVDTSQFRNGLKIELDGEPFSIIYFQHVKPGKGGAFVRTKVRNLKSGRVLERRFRAGERVELADVEERKMQYLYQDGEQLVFMDTQSYEQIPFSTEQVGDARKFLKANKLTCPAGLDPHLKIANRFGFRGTPYTVVINQKGEMVARIHGRSDEARLSRILDPLAKPAEPRRKAPAGR